MKFIARLSDRLLPYFFNSRYRLARWTRKSRLFGKIVMRLLFDEDDMVVLPKDSTVKNIELDIEIKDAGERTVLPSDVIKQILAREEEVFIMNHCLCRKSNKCTDYPIDRGCIFLGRGIHRIPEDMGHMATPDEAIEYIDECSQLGFVHIIGRNKLDSMWLSTGDKRDLMTICNCCPCCCLWNMVRDISKDISDSYKRMDGVTVSVNTDNCVGCGSCRDICFTRAIEIREGKCSIDQSKCRGCGRCHDRCDFDAISVSFDPSIVPREVKRISSLFNGRSP